MTIEKGVAIAPDRNLEVGAVIMLVNSAFAYCFKEKFQRLGVVM